MTKRKLSSNQASPETTWWDEETKHFDSVVFVHGIIGDQIKTWGEFPALLHQDPELPKLAVLQWGYRSGLVPGNYLGIELESKGLLTDLQLLTMRDEPIHIVAHSMGGLVTLKAITDAVVANQSSEHPVNSVTLITLFATPLNGSAWADLINDKVAKWKWFAKLSRYLPKQQAEDLGTEGFVDSLRESVERHVKPVGTNESTPAERITVQVVLAKRDQAVTLESGEGPFSGEPATLLLEGSHGSVKLPDHLGDVRYKALKTNLVRKLAQRLNHFASQWQSTSSVPIDAKLSAMRIGEQYDSQLQFCFERCFGGRYLTDAEEDAVFTTFLVHASSGVYEPEVVVRMTIADFLVPDTFINSASPK